MIKSEISGVEVRTALRIGVPILFLSILIAIYFTITMTNKMNAIKVLDALIFEYGEFVYDPENMDSKIELGYLNTTNCEKSIEISEYKIPVGLSIYVLDPQNNELHWKRAEYKDYKSKNTITIPAHGTFKMVFYLKDFNLKYNKEYRIYAKHKDALSGPPTIINAK